MLTQAMSYPQFDTFIATVWKKKGALENIINMYQNCISAGLVKRI